MRERMRVAPLDWRRNFTIGGAKRSRLTAIAGTATRNDRTKGVRTAEGRTKSRRKGVLPHLRDNDTLLPSLSRPLRLTNPLNINTQSPHPSPSLGPVLVGSRDRVPLLPPVLTFPSSLILPASLSTPFFDSRCFAVYDGSRYN